MLEDSLQGLANAMNTDLDGAFAVMSKPLP
jgi:hypothetical protein